MKQLGYTWRSSRALVVGTACVALFTETLLYGFLVPILPYMLEVRLHIDPAQTQSLTTKLLTSYGIVTLLAAPIVANLADRIGSRKIPLLISLASCLVGTLIVAFTPSLWTLFLGRFLQGFASSGAWILSLAMITESVEEKDMGKMTGLCMSFVVAGTLSGPILSGALLEWVGYSLAWLVPSAMLVLDLLARCIMIDARRDEYKPAPVDEDEEEGESESDGFYRTMLRDPRVLSGLCNVALHSALIAGFNTTWPVHLRQIFNWGSYPVGTVFFTLQLPAVLLGTIAGWLRDKVGNVYPTVAGWVLLAPLLCGLGVPSTNEPHAKIVFVACVAGIGILQPLVQSAGFINTMSVSQSLETKTPGLFGPHGARSRVFATNEMAFHSGLMLGPLLAGGFSEMAGYGAMTAVLAAMCLAQAGFVLWWFHPGPGRGEGEAR